MNLTKHTDYALRILLHLAIQPGRKLSIANIATTEDISRNHLMKVSQSLARLGYIVGYRGKGGGIALAKPAHTVNIGQLLQQVERNLQPVDGMEAGQPAAPGLLLEQALEDARTSFIQSMSQYTLADLVADALRRPEEVIEEDSQSPLLGEQGAG
ncbi:MAG: Rrf2 family transcriptional regulator [Alphaproteobacteria bacterium]|nr:Rrf2 family transcriptional regulator [Alphaproteobacteria bacterium]